MTMFTLELQKRRSKILQHTKSFTHEDYAELTQNFRKNTEKLKGANLFQK